MLAAQLLFDTNDRLWYLYSGGDFLASKRLHPHSGDDVHLVEIPVVQWSHVSPMLLDLSEIEDPFKALERQKELHLKEQLDQQRAFVRGSLTPAEERVAAMLVREGLSDNEIAERLYLSPRTVEQHLRSAYTKAAAHWELVSVSRTQLVALLGLYYTVEFPKLRENPHA
jgi:DNA-binding CsgD family transcriptional regulator